MIKFFGNIRNIDPGKPGVADFGRKIYHLSIPKSIDSISNMDKRAIQRKFSHMNFTDKKSFDKIFESLQNFKDRISKAEFNAVVFDYDGTLCDPENRFNQPSKEIEALLSNLLNHDIIIGIATGRGKSVRKELQKIVPCKFWSKILIAYYNGDIIGSLDDESKPEITSSTDPELLKFLELLKKQKNMKNSFKIEKRPKQISIQSDDLSAKEIIDKYELILNSKKRIRIVESSHSIDILSADVSKLNLLDHLKKKYSKKLQILCIGDKGKFPGNDYDLLTTEYALSVDQVNDDVKSCWNLSETKGELGVLEYFHNMRIYKDYFMLQFGM